MLAVHPGALGDVLLAIPALRALRAATPGAPLVLAAQLRIGALLRALRVVDDAVPFDALRLDVLFTDEPLLEVPRALAKASRVISWFGARDPRFVRRLSALVPDAIVAPSVGERAPVWEHLLRTVGAPAGAWRDPVAVPAPLIEEGRAALLAAGWDRETRLVVVHPGAGGRSKCWSPEGFAAVVETARAAGAAVAIHEGPADVDAEAGRDLCARLGGAVARLQDPALPALAGALREAALYLGNDSGVSHLAAALGVPSLVLFRREMLAWRPWSPAAEPVVVCTERLVADDVATVADAVRGYLR